MPYALPFVERLRLFKQFVDTEKATATQRAHSGEPGVRVRIRRGRVLQDGLRELNGLGEAVTLHTHQCMDGIQVEQMLILVDQKL